MKIPIIKNTVTNYISAAVLLFEGVLVARWIIAFAGKEYYGLWTLLWSFFSYALLLEFGCGKAAQKSTAIGLYQQDERKYSRTISTIFTFHCLMALVIGLATFACSFLLGDITKIADPEKLLYAKKCFYIFGISAALLFSFGIFQEILIGLQKLYIRNFIIIITKLLELLGIFIIFTIWDGLLPIVIFIMSLTVLSNVAMCIWVKFLLPEMKLRLHLDLGILREIAGFSGFIYLGVVSRVIINKSNRLLISIFCGLESVALFHLSSKAAELCLQGVIQYQENISPITGALHRRGRHKMLSKIVLGAMRWSSFASCALMLPAFMLIEPILLVLFKVSGPELNYLSRIFLLSMYLSAVLRIVPNNYLIMSERHRFATWVIVVEAVTNLTLNIVLLWLGYNMSVVIWNSLIIKAGLAIFIITPFMLKCLHISLADFLLKVFCQPLLSCIPVFIYISAVQRYTSLQNWSLLFIGGGGAVAIYVTCMALWMPKAIRLKYSQKIFRLLKMS